MSSFVKFQNIISLNKYQTVSLLHNTMKNVFPSDFYCIIDKYIQNKFDF